MKTIYTLANIYNYETSRSTRLQIFSSAIRDDLVKEIFLHVFDQQNTVGTVVSMKQLKKFSESQSKTVLFDADDKLRSLLDLLKKCYTRELSGLEARKSLMSACEAGGYYADLFGKICNKVSPPLISTTTARKHLPELASKFSLALCRGVLSSINYDVPHIVEEKLDGMRVVIFKEDGVPKIYTRNCKELNANNFSIIIRDLETVYDLDEYAIDGEICAKDRFETISLAKSKFDLDDHEKSKLVLHSFDIIKVDALLRRGGTPTLEDRKKHLHIMRDTDSVKVNPWWLIHSEQDYKNQYQQIIDRGGEGVIIKCFESQYEYGNSQSWIKLKFDKTCDVRVTGWAMGNGRLEDTLGYIEVDYKGSTVRVNVPADKDRDELFNMAKDGALIGSLVEVLHNGETPYGSLNHPRFISLRDDKDEVSL